MLGNLIVLEREYSDEAGLALELILLPVEDVSYLNGIAAVSIELVVLVFSHLILHLRVLDELFDGEDGDLRGDHAPLLFHVGAERFQVLSVDSDHEVFLSHRNLIIEILF